MRLKVCTIDEGEWAVDDFSADSALDLKGELNDPEAGSFVTLAMDGGTVLLNRDHIVSVEFD